MWNEKWIRRFKRNIKIYIYILIGISIVLFLSNLVVILIYYFEFWIPGCIENKIYISVMVIYMVVNIILLSFKYSKQSSIFKVIFVSFYFNCQIGRILIYGGNV